MKRDMELIRKILLNIEAGKPNESVAGYESETLRYHQALIIEAGLAEGKALAESRHSTEVPSAVFIKKLTWEGHDFIEAIEDDTKWNKVKEYIYGAGKQLTIETVKFAVIQLFRFAVS